MSDAAVTANLATGSRFWVPRLSAGWVGGVLLTLIAVPCFATLYWSLGNYDTHRIAEGLALQGPSLAEPMGTDLFGRSLMWRCLLGGAISLGSGPRRPCWRLASA